MYLPDLAEVLTVSQAPPAPGPPKKCDDRSFFDVSALPTHPPFKLTVYTHHSHSPLNTHHSTLTTHHPPLTTHHSPFTRSFHLPPIILAYHIPYDVLLPIVDKRALECRNFKICRSHSFLKMLAYKIPLLWNVYLYVLQLDFLLIVL